MNKKIVQTGSSVKSSDILKEIFPDPLAPTAGTLDDALAASFYPEDSTRLAHMRQACSTAQRIVSQTGCEGELAGKITTAALFHDIGYSEKLSRTGFHPLDGAVYLAHCDAPEDIVEAVLWHSSTPVDIEYKPEIKEIYDRLPRPDLRGPVHSAVRYCDFRTSPVGEPFSFGQRIVELEGRFGLGSIPPQTARRLLPEARRVQNMYSREIAGQQHRNLPWIFCDIDGTLIEPGQSLDRRSLAAINRYTTAGGRFSLVTGKHMISVPELIQSVGSHNPHAGVNGSVIIRDGRISLFGETVEPCEEIENILLRENINYATYVTDGIWSRSDLSAEQINAFAMVGEVLPQSGPTPLANGVIKILTFSHRSQRKQCEFVRALAAEFGLNCVRTGEEFLEIGPAGHGKHSAAMQIMKEAGWPDLNSIAIGDSENDLSLFARAGLSAAVANAAPEVLPAADLHIPSCRECGVARLLDALLDSAKDGQWSIPANWLVDY
ncbi:HAD-IIB family hydrolase [Maridesulfovibrio sp.]|uniref:HAD-IIB family hydrolase n=1 Tax=Maridesulfovibrio sp. TaxID=2795000 RepID=UPI002A18C609|nr:HAD-IIB family hydrolase [Maridesulfovibrio sp.]